MRVVWTFRQTRAYDCPRPDFGAGASMANSVFSDVRDALGGLFGGKLDAKLEALVQGMFGLLGAMARADGVVSTEEAAFTNKLMEELKLSARARQLATEAFARGCKRDYDIDQESATLTGVFPYNSDEVRRVYDSLIRLATADAMVRPGERRFLEKVTAGLGFPPEELDSRIGTKS
jgi:DnaJ like chaperone protein